MHRSTRAAAAALLLALPFVPGLAPVASAHCDPGSGSTILGLVSTCPYNGDVEAALQAASAATGGTVAFVLVKDYTFHPNVVTVKSGGTVVFLYADTEGQAQHDPRSSGPCTDAGVDPALAPEACVPSAPGRCFDVRRDQGADLKQVGDSYPLTFRYTPAASLIEKSRGILSGTPVVGQPPLAEAFKACPAGSGATGASRAVVPYHCGNHGGSGTPIQTMRGAIIVVA